MSGALLKEHLKFDNFYDVIKLYATNILNRFTTY